MQTVMALDHLEEFYDALFFEGNMKAVFLIVLFWSASAFAKTPDSVSWQEWVPQGWKLIRSAAGDLNQDGKDDAALLLEQDDPAKRRPNGEMGAPVLNLNPRRIVILFQTAGGYGQPLLVQNGGWTRFRLFPGKRAVITDGRMV